MEKITTRAQLQDLAVRLGVRGDWHEPDEQGLTVKVKGKSFDNAGFWPQGEGRDLPPSIVEHHVIIRQNGEDIAAVNLATLFAWASSR
jgi:hypothetical protein